MASNAPPLVLLHPFPLDAGFWAPLRSLLSAGCDVIAPEFPGLGSAPPQAFGPTIEGASDLVAEIIRREPGGRAVVCGLSMGGYVALSLAVRHPDTVAGLILANTRAEADDAAGRAGRDAGIARVLGGGSAAYLDELLPRLVANHADPSVCGRVREIADRQTPGGIAGALAALRDRPDRTGDLARIGVPALVIWGEDDRVTPEVAARHLAEALPDGRFLVIPEAGHLSALERPEAFAAAIGTLQPWR